MKTQVNIEQDGDQLLVTAYAEWPVKDAHGEMLLHPDFRKRLNKALEISLHDKVDRHGNINYRLTGARLHGLYDHCEYFDIPMTLLSAIYRLLPKEES